MAIAREAGLTRLGIPLSDEIRTGNRLVINGNDQLAFKRSWKIASDEEIRAVYSLREVAAHLLNLFQNGWGRTTTAEVRQERAIITLQHLCSDEQTQFS